MSVFRRPPPIQRRPPGAALLTAAAGGALTFALSAGATTATPDTAALSVARPVAAVIAATSATPDTANLGTGGPLAMSAAATSATPDTATLNTGPIRSLAMSAAATSSTWDSVTLGPARTSLRFYGTASGGIDRVRIPLLQGDLTTRRPTDLGAADFTVEAWIRCTYAANTSSGISDARYSNIVFDRDVYGHPRGWVMGVTRRPGTILALCFGLAGGSGTWTTIYGTTNLGDNAWHHIALTWTFSTGTARIWVDGALEGTQAYSGMGDLSYPVGFADDPAAQDNPYLVIGTEKHDLGVGYTGLVDEIRLSNTARYTSTFAPSTADVFAPDSSTRGLYHADDASGTVLADSAQASGSPTNGELRVGGASNGPTWQTDSPIVPRVTFAAAAAALSATPDALALPVLRALLAQPAAATTTPDTLALPVARALSAAGAAASATPDTLALAVARLSALAASAASTTPDALALAVTRLASLAAAASSVTPDDATLRTAAAFALAATAGTTTPDDAAVVVARALSLAGAATSATPDAALAALRALALGVSASSATPTTATLLTGAAWAFTASAASATPDGALLPVARALAATVAAQSSTPVARASVARALAVAAAGASATPDTVNLLTAAIQGLMTASRITAAAPSATFSASRPSATFTSEG